MTVLGDGDGADSRAECRTEDVFRRATFAWALAAKKMVESAAALGLNTRVSAAALADMVYVRDAVASMHVPAAKTITTDEDHHHPLTAGELSNSISDLITRIEPWRDNSTNQAHAHDIMKVPSMPGYGQVMLSKTGEWVDPPMKHHRGADLSAPVHSRGGKMLWATVDCPVCPSKAEKRCQKSGGVYIEKPHKQRVRLVEVPRNDS